MPMIPSTGTVHPSEPSWDRTLATFEEMQVRCCLKACTEQVQALQQAARQQGASHAVVFGMPLWARAVAAILIHPSALQPVACWLYHWKSDCLTC